MKINTFLIAIFTLTLSLLVISCDQNQKKENGSEQKITGIAINIENDDITESEYEQLTDAEKTELMTKDAPAEGLSQFAYEDLEMPAEIKGGREAIFMKTQFTVSYNSKTRCPNYVCWHLSSDRTLGNMQRTDEFVADPTLSGNIQVQSFDYSGSGYDRGHMCPAGDNKNSSQAMNESFFMTNICPQNHDLNKGDWNDLEQLCREWARDYGDLYICCGPIFDSDNPKTIGRRKKVQIAVPDRFFKVVLFMGKQPRAIGFIFPNDGKSRPLRSYAVSVDKVERVTGFDFYPILEDDIEDKVEAECNPSAWNF